MKPDPVLARTIIPANPAGGQKYPHTFKVEGGLHYIQGNSAPYFTLTYTEHRQGFPNQDYSGGCNPDLILQHFPQFADLAALHLSDIDGVPMHAESNGWYQLAGALGGFSEKYHAGNSKGNFPLPADRLDPAAPWRTMEQRLPTREECLQSFARHCRISIEEARQICAEVDPRKWRDVAPEYDHQTKTYFVDWLSMEQTNPGYLTNCRARWAVICAGMHPRWKLEADACIVKHGLTLYGDPWDGELLWSMASPRRPAPGEHPDTPPDEQTYIDLWGISSTATLADSNPNMVPDDGDSMTHWRVTLHRGRARMTVYYSMGSAHAEREPTTQDVIDCIVSDAGSVDSARSFEEWARDLGYDSDSRSAHRTYAICKRQAERLQKFLGADHYAELMGAA